VGYSATRFYSATRDFLLAATTTSFNQQYLITTMAKLDLEEENRIRTVMAIIQKNPHVNRAKLCRIHRVYKDKLRRRIKSVPNVRTASSYNKRLNTTQNEEFKRFILYLIK
jgi:hypothetical protein